MAVLLAVNPALALLGPAGVNGCHIAALALAAAFLARGRGRVCDLRSPRSRWILLGAPALVAALAAAPTLAFPYFSDDWAHLRFHGLRPHPFDALLHPSKGEMWFRPVVWVLWWFLGRFAPTNAAAGHILCTILFAANAALTGPVLRRLGAPRGLSFAGALLFAAHPAGLDTAAWITNAELLLSTGFAWAALLCIPPRGASAERVAGAAALCALSVLSKETIYPIVGVAFLAGCRGRLGRWRAGVRAALPFAAVVGSGFVARWVFLGGFGGYVDPITGKKMLSAETLATAVGAFATDLPARSWLPVRPGVGPWVEGIASALPVAALAFLPPRAAARRGLVVGGAVFLLLLATTLPKFPLDPYLSHLRHLYAPALGLSLLWVCAGAGRLRWAIPAAALAASLGIGQWNLGAYRRAAQAIEVAAQASGAELAKLPQKSQIAIYGLPDMIEGVQSELEFALPALAGRRDLELTALYSAVFDVDALFRMDWERKELVDWSDPIPARRLDAGRTRVFSLPADREPESLQFPQPLETLQPPEKRVGVRQSEQVALPVLDLSGVGRVRVHVDGLVLWPDGTKQSAPPLLTWRKDGKIHRSPVPPDAWLDVPAGATWLRVEALALASPASAIHSISVEAQPK